MIQILIEKFVSKILCHICLPIRYLISITTTNNNTLGILHLSEIFRSRTCLTKSPNLWRQFSWIIHNFGHREQNCVIPMTNSRCELIYTYTYIQYYVFVK